MKIQRIREIKSSWERLGENDMYVLQRMDSEAQEKPLAGGHVPISDACVYKERTLFSAT